ncbi:Hypothetical protein, putative [Bodo saltans]|uniref:SAM-dependent MTase RsmB/NOP-type domain-containing protein n=1 Tax=Bodo saltans TaxID=75058 RepID=A0A0S4JUU1_BODSA|nr:Hypothetical protein, putative [Bodo saltans]|eukprot:CUG92328.1 Hypothetical protein, putative [Bodo saltans]
MPPDRTPTPQTAGEAADDQGRPTPTSSSAPGAHNGQAAGFAQTLRAFLASSEYKHSVHLEEHLLGEGREVLSEAQSLFINHRTLYGFPPRSTNLRLVFSSTCVEPLVAIATDPSPQTSDLTTTFIEESLQEYRIATLADVGLPMCTSITPRKDGRDSSQQDGQPEKEWFDLSSHPFVVVDIPCAEAVLRGADIFAPGVLASSASYNVGDVVLVLAVVNPVHQPKKASYHAAREFWATTPPEELCGEAEGDARTAFGPTVMIAKATCLMRRFDVAARHSKGVAFRTTWSPAHQPSRDLLMRLIHTAPAWKELADSRQRTGPDIFLQNWSSMVPVVWLTDDITDGVTHEAAPATEADDSVGQHHHQRQWRFLDACAAPGGKTSLLLDLCMSAIKHPSTIMSDFHVTTCERSKPRNANLKKLLESHFSSELIASHVRCRVGDVTQLLLSSSEQHTAAEMFDRIVLDPPCTGLGLRPKLLPFPLPLDEVTRSAQYQRTLFTACWSRLAVNGRLSYSTCTISEEENEDNIRWALATFPDAMLVPASTPGQRALVTTFGCSEFSDQASGLMNLCCRFYPTPDNEVLDGVGFFVALFRKREL